MALSPGDAPDEMLWKCCGCGIPTPNRLGVCECPTECLYQPGTPHSALKESALDKLAAPLITAALGMKPKRTYSQDEVSRLIEAARAQGRASLEERCAALEEALAGVQPWAEMGFFLRDNQSSAYGDRYSQPEELAIQWEWQQSTPDDYGDASLRHDIDGWLESLIEDASPEVLEHPVVKARALLATPGERANG